MFSQIRKKLIPLSFATVLALTSACSGDGTNDQNDAAYEKSGAEQTESASNTSSNSMPEGHSAVRGSPILKPVTYDQWELVRDGVQPNILVVDLWATWCVPCLERFPAMVRMSEEYVYQGVQFISLSLDDREDNSSIRFAEEFLSKQNAQFDHYFLDENILDGFDKLGIQTVPAVDIYDRDGRRAYRLTGDNPNEQFTEKDVEDAIKALIAG